VVISHARRFVDRRDEAEPAPALDLGDHYAAVGQDRVYLVDVLLPAPGLVPGRRLLRICASVGFEFVDAGVCGVEFVL
jgi:hypothetical protein